MKIGFLWSIQSRKVHGRLNASWKISSLAVNGQSFLVIDGYLLNPFFLSHSLHTTFPRFKAFSTSTSRGNGRVSVNGGEEGIEWVSSIHHLPASILGQTISCGLVRMEGMETKRRPTTIHLLLDLKAKAK